jgi:hypothetical protein
MPNFNKTAFMWGRASARRIPSMVIFPRAKALPDIKADFGSSEKIGAMPPIFKIQRIRGTFAFVLGSQFAYHLVC